MPSVLHRSLWICEILGAHILSAEKEVFAWGKNDCALWCADWVRKATGNDFAQGWAGSYSSKAELRNLLQESGLECDTLRLRGTVNWPGFGPNGEDWFGFIFRIESWHGEIQSGNYEGTLEWVPLDAIYTLSLWPSDRNFLPMVFDADPRLFHGCMPYHNGEMVSWSYQRV